MSRRTRPINKSQLSFRPGEKETLQQLAAKPDNCFAFSIGLDSLGNDQSPHGLGKRHNGRHDLLFRR